MTRGKYAARATNRRDSADVEASEAAYQRQIVRLTKERDEARSSLADLKKKSQAELRRLSALVNEGTSDQVAALRHQMNKLRTERNRATHDAAQQKLGYMRLGRHVVAHLMADDGMTFAQGCKVFSAWLGKSELPQEEIDEALTEAGVKPTPATRDGWSRGWDYSDDIRLSTVQLQGRGAA